MVVHTKRTPQELIHEIRISGFEGRGGTQEALYSEWKGKMKVQGGQKETSQSEVYKLPAAREMQLFLIIRPIALSEGPHKIGTLVLLSEDGDTTSFRNSDKCQIQTVDYVYRKFSNTKITQQFQIFTTMLIYCIILSIEENCNYTILSTTECQWCAWEFSNNV
jgi:hypothetical protein